MRIDLKVGKVSPESYFAQLAGINQIERQQGIILKTVKLSEKMRAPLSAIAGIKMIGDLETEEIKCPGLSGKMIMRSECLDFSGEEKFKQCLCKVGKETQELLLGAK